MNISPSFEEDSHPADEASNSLKGILLNGYSIYSDSISCGIEQKRHFYMEV